MVHDDQEVFAFTDWWIGWSVSRSRIADSTMRTNYEETVYESIREAEKRIEGGGSRLRRVLKSEFS